MRDQGFEGRVAIVTGGGKGIGRATAIEFAARGARVVVGGQSEAPLKGTLALIEGAGGKGVLIVGDVSEERVTRAASKWGVVGLTKVGAIDTPLFVETIENGSVKRDDFEKYTPMNRIAGAEEVAAAATWLCSDATSYVTGVLLPVEGGMTL